MTMEGQRPRAPTRFHWTRPLALQMAIGLAAISAVVWGSLQWLGTSAGHPYELAFAGGALGVVVVEMLLLAVVRNPVAASLLLATASGLIFVSLIIAVVQHLFWEAAVAFVVLVTMRILLARWQERRG